MISIKPKERQPSCLTNLRFYYTEYCNNSTIHGLKFLSERRRSIIEKIWWLIFVGLSLYFCIALILNTYHKWMNSPVIISFATSETPIWKIPFPAVTICPFSRIDPRKINFTSSTEEGATKLKYASLICPKIRKTYPKVNEFESLDDRGIKFLIDVAPDFGEIVFACSWTKDKCSYKTDQFFTPILTSAGFCYTFNMLDRDEIFTNETAYDYYHNLSIDHQPVSNWSVEDGYPDQAKLKTYPRRTLLIGDDDGLELTLFTSVVENSYHCEDALLGYKVILHNPEIIPRPHEFDFWVPLDQMISVSVQPNMITTSKELRGYNPDDRKCYFKTEKRLRFFKIYNQENCLLECLTNYTYQKCDCVWFYMPRNNDMPVCGPAKFRCRTHAIRDFNNGRAIFQIRRFNKTSKRLTIDCNCISSCHALRFDAATTQMDWDWRRENILNSSYDNKTSHLSKVRIYYKDLQIMACERGELYGQTEFWANCGGLLGLFTGFSFISLIEIIYFATLRIVCSVRKYGWHYWSGADELLEVKVSN